MANVFVYGSLLAEDVLEILIKRVPASRSAILHGFRRYGLRDRVYPAIVPSRDSSVQGKVLLDLTQPELDRLDDFEGEEYEKRAVEPAVFKLSHSDAAQQIDAGAETPITALVYVWSNPDDPDLVGHWDYEQWRRSHLDLYLQDCQEYMQSNWSLPAAEITGIEMVKSETHKS